MKYFGTIALGVALCLASCYTAKAQTQPLPASKAKKKIVDSTAMHKGPILQARQLTFSVSTGFGDPYRTDYSVPAMYQKSDVSGFAPIYGRAEYAVSKYFGLGATFSYDAFYAAYYQIIEKNGSVAVYKRNHTDKVTVFGAGLNLYYHLGNVIKSKKLDPYISAGFALNKITHDAAPATDTIQASTLRTVSPSLRVGVRYYFTPIASFMVDAGYDKQSYCTVGFACRFPKKK